MEDGTICDKRLTRLHRGERAGSVCAAGARLTRHGVLRALAGASAGGLLAACGQAGSTDRAAPASGGVTPPATLRFAADKSRLDAGLQTVIDGFNARGGPIKVEPELVTGSLVDKILSQAAGGDAPDLTHTHPRDYHPWVNGGALLALDDYMKRDRAHVPDLVPTALDYWSRAGKRWAMPNNLSVQNMYFNKDLFDRTGVKHPDQYEKEGKWTFETYLDIARKLTSGQGETKIFGATWMASALDIQLGFIWPFGGDLWDKEQKRTLLDSKEAREAIQFQADLTHKYGVAPTADEWRAFSAAPAAGWGAAFSAGRAAIELQPNDSLLQHVVAATFPKGMVPMPKGRAGRATRGLAVGAHITKGSKHPDAAWEFANYQSDKDSEKIMLDLHVSLPWHKSSLATLEKSMPLAPWENGAYYAEGVRQLRVTPYVPQFAEINRLYSTGYTEVRHGRKTAAELLTEIKPQIDSLLKE